MHAHLSRASVARGSWKGALLILLVAIIGACGGGSAAVAPQDGSGTGSGPAAQPIPAKGGSSAGEDNGGSSGAGNGGNGGKPATDPGAPVDDALIVRTGTLTLEVTDLGRAVADGRAAISGLGGYIAGSVQSSDGDRSRATVTYRIPVARWDEALEAIRRIGARVVEERTDSVEVTGQVVDLSARIDNLRATERALQGIMTQATKISDILSVQQQLTDVQGQIEQLTAARQHLADQAALSSLTVQFGQPVVAVAEVRKGWDAGAEIDQAAASLVDLLQRLAAAGIWFTIVVAPVIIVLGLVLGLALLLRRRLVGRRGRGSGPASVQAGS